jgi:hypothetical protein
MVTSTISLKLVVSGETDVITFKKGRFVQERVAFLDFKFQVAVNSQVPFEVVVMLKAPGLNTVFTVPSARVVPL